MATQKAKSKSPAKKSRNMPAKRRQLTVAKDSTLVDGVETKFTLTADVYICAETIPPPKEAVPTTFELKMDNNPDKSITSMQLKGTPPELKIMRIMDAFGVESEELKNAVDGVITIDKISYENIKTKKPTAAEYTGLDFGISFAPSKEFVLNKFEKVLYIEKLAVNFTKREGTKPEEK